MRQTTRALIRRPLATTLVIFVCLIVIHGQQQDTPKPGKPGRDGASVTLKDGQPTIPGQPQTGVATLYSRDPLAQTLCFENGNYGAVIQDNKVKTHCSDIDFDQYKEASLTVAIQGRQGSIVDIGTLDELQKEYGYSETVGYGQGFASIQMKGKTFLISKGDSTGEAKELKEAGPLFQKTKPMASASIKVGHIYLVFVEDKNRSPLMVKILVVSYSPKETVTLRWVIM